MKSKTFIPFLITLICAVILVASFFLPFAAANGSYRDYLKSYPDYEYAGEIGMTNSDAVDISLLEYMRIYIAGLDYSLAISVICLVLISAIALFSLLVLLFAALRKPIPLLIFNCLNFGAFSLLSFDFSDRGVLPSSNYALGFANYLYYVISAALLAGSIWLLIVKVREKRMNTPV